MRSADMLARELLEADEAAEDYKTRLTAVRDALLHASLPFTKVCGQQAPASKTDPRIVVAVSQAIVLTLATALGRAFMVAQP
jgi:hypothetical protein